MEVEVIFAGSDAPVNPNQSVFLAGPSPKDGALLQSWRRQLIERFKSTPHKRIDHLQLIVPEPETGHWRDVMSNDYTEKHQTLWEHNCMLKSKVIAFWLPTFWTPKNAGVYPANIGPSSRFEFGFFLNNSIRNAEQKLVVGSPEKAESLQWAQVLCEQYGITWHFSESDAKQADIPPSFYGAILKQLDERKQL